MFGTFGNWLPAQPLLAQDSQKRNGTNANPCRGSTSHTSQQSSRAAAAAAADGKVNVMTISLIIDFTGLKYDILKCNENAVPRTIWRTQNISKHAECAECVLGVQKLKFYI